ncbi:MAG: CoA-binding protein [Streptococcus sp.]|nr:CoA-binding protein [Streptococcus sp.]
MFEVYKHPSQEEIVKWIKVARHIAVVGLSDREETASYQVSKVMQDAGYKIFSINPRQVGQQILGEPVLASLLDLKVPIDIVCVFRRSEYLADVAREFVQIDAEVYWAQLGLESQEAYAILKGAGCSKIVMDKCLKIEYYNSLSNLN